jgi:ketosteroid isomerase-like protein
MSGENVRLVCRSTDAFNRGDLNGFMEGWRSDAVVNWSNSRGFEAGVYRGRDEIRAFVQRFREAFEEVRIEFLDDPAEVQEGLVFAENVTYLRGRDGIEVQARSAWLITFENGEQTSLTMYQTKRDALEAAGLSE